MKKNSKKGKGVLGTMSGSVVYNPQLDEYTGKVLAPGKLQKANEIIKRWNIEGFIQQQITVPK